MNTQQTVLLLLPIALIGLGLLLYSLYDLTRPWRRVKGGNKWVWGIILFINFIGPLAYLLAGREEE
ncbi:MAG TPA: PLDc N-terminal domain-containing protein [Thermomicrobiaceae bacterium]|nr:PLDc N-terminal domain-containing protein [Thermomicrobiaceae bacterium]